MKSKIRSSVIVLGYLASSLLYACASDVPDTTSDIVYVGSTPGDPAILTMLGLLSQPEVDFIRWHLTFSKNDARSGEFVMDLNYGVAKQNTLGFIDGGKKLNCAGSYHVSEQNGKSIYSLVSDEPVISLQLVMLTENLLHILTSEQRLMIGNGGWSYTLNRMEPITELASLPATLSTPASGVTDNTEDVVFDGRTPCMPFAQQYALQVGEDCIKLKWRLTLHTDPMTTEPSTYTLQRTGSRMNDITGTWTLMHASTTGVIIYVLDPDKPERSLFLLQGDENVLFLLDRNQQLYVGNKDFSYTLNRRNS